MCLICGKHSKHTEMTATRRSVLVTKQYTLYFEISYKSIDLLAVMAVTTRRHLSSDSPFGFYQVNL